MLGDADADCAGGDPGAGGGGLFDFLDDLVDSLLGGGSIEATAITSQCTADASGVTATSSVVGLDGGGTILMTCSGAASI